MKIDRKVSIVYSFCLDDLLVNTGVREGHSERDRDKEREIERERDREPESGSGKEAEARRNTPRARPG